MTRSKNTREKLLDTAIDLIWKSNYTRVGVNEICKCAGVTKGGFYHYFETKADLFYEASLYHWAQKQDELDEIFSPRYTPLEQLENLVNHILDHQASDEGDDNPVLGCPFFTSGAQVGTGEDKVREASRIMCQNAIQYDLALARGLKAGGYLNGDPDCDQLARMMMQYIQGLLLYGRTFADIEIVRNDIRAGLYRLLDLKAEYRVAATPATAAA
ncbi:TetR/AcrR family transcriptional regulator [Kordiimonas gwangyangensis]|uniref:TetR/AcrR family transcriptional regulator n=1 Tax=Kordiimonas gwangyangensis TaxID=288022 RepID=UPI000377E842|nr:TetR/AcrR family transcriptional regulator [Kordiimonas gwangyangensis]